MECGQPQAPHCILCLPFGRRETVCKQAGMAPDLPTTSSHLPLPAQAANLPPAVVVVQPALQVPPAGKCMHRLPCRNLHRVHRPPQHINSKLICSRQPSNQRQHSLDPAPNQPAAHLRILPSTRPAGCPPTFSSSSALDASQLMRRSCSRPTLNHSARLARSASLSARSVAAPDGCS